MGISNQKGDYKFEVPKLRLTFFCLTHFLARKKIMKCAKIFVVMLVVAFLSCGFAVTASASYLNDSWDFGDINGGYQTSSYPSDNLGDVYAQMSANIGGQHKIDGSNISFLPDYQYSFDKNGNVTSKTIRGYQVEAYISGRITAPLTTADVGDQSQSNQFNARGIDLYENSWIDTYKSYGYSDPGGYELFSHAGSSIYILNFVVQSANGRYNEYTYNNGGGLGMGVVPAAGGVVDTTTYFNYNVTWYGDFVPGTLSSGFVAPAMITSTNAVPEPSTFVLMAVGATVGLGVYLRRSKRS